MRGPGPAAAAHFKPREGFPLTSERYYYDTYGGYAAYRPVPSRRPARPMQRAQAVQGQRRAGAPARSAGHAAARTSSGRPVPPRRAPAAQAARRAPEPGRRPPARANGRDRGMFLAIALSLVTLLAVLLVFAGVKLLGRKPAPVEDRFVNNVYVNGLCLTGLTKDEGYALMYQKRDEWLNTVYPLTFQDRTWEFSPAQVGATLDMDDALDSAWSLGHIGDQASRKQIIEALQETPAEFDSTPTYDEAAIDAFVAQVAKDVYTEPVDAEITLTTKKPTITRASVNGWKLDEEALKASLIRIIETGQSDGKLPVNEVQPMIASDRMEMDVIATCETDTTFRGNPSRTNLRLALEHFNLLAVYPGDTVSFNAVVGPRTEALGYKEAPEYAGSNKEMGIGGGVCQASTTLYNAVIQAGMTIIERHRHTMTVTYVDPSLDAAVNYGKKDLVFRNDTEHAIYIYTNVNKKYATVTIYGTRPKYRYVLESTVLRESDTSDKVGYQDDEEGTHVYYTTDEPVLYRKGHGSCESEGWIVSYDWDTGTVVDTVQISHDVYSAGVNVYWRGVHTPDGGNPSSTPEVSSF